MCLIKHKSEIKHNIKNTDSFDYETLLLHKLTKELNLYITK